MVKALLASLLFMLSVQLGAQSSPYYMDHETFVQLPAMEQKKLLVGFMQFMVEMEAMYPKQVLTSDYDQKRKEFLEKIVLHLNTIQELMLSSAHAQNDADVDPFREYREKFESTMKKVGATTGKTMCIYGGWISTTIDGICQHPSKGKINSYILPKGMKLGPEDIACNPLIFGFKDPVKKTLFTAVATSSSVNSSLDCMQQSQGVKKDKNGIDIVDNNKDARMQQLKDAYLSKDFSGQYNAMTKFIHQTCLCNDGSNHMNPQYLSRIQPHRTCFSLLNQYRNLRSNGCSSNLMDLGLNVDNVQDIFEKNIKDMQEDLDGLKIKPQSTISLADKKKLSDLDKGFKDLLGDANNQKKFCEAQQVSNQTCKILSCSQGDKGAVSCDIEILGTKSPKSKQTVSMVNGSAVVKGMIPIQSLKAQDVTCSMAAPTCAVGVCANGKCSIKISGGSVANKADESISFGDETSKTIKVIPDGLDAKSSFSVTCTAPAKDPKCEVTKCTSDKATGEKTCDFTVAGFATKEKDQKTFKVAKDSKDKEVEIALENGKSVKCEIKDEETKSSCTLTIAENKDDKKKVDVSLVLTLLDGDTATAPTFDPTFTATADDKKLNYTATIDLATIADGKKITASKFSKNFPDEVCFDTYPKDDAKPQITLEKGAPTKNSVGIFIIIVTAKISVETIDKTGLKWTGGNESTDKAPEKREVEQSKEKQEICVSHDEVKTDDGKPTCITIDAAKEEKATLSLVGTNKSNQTFDLKATVTLSGKDFKDVLSDGYTLVWFEKNRPELSVEEKAARDKKIEDKKEAEKKTKEKEKTKKSTGQSGDSDTEDPKTKTPAKKDETKATPVDGEVQNSTGLTYSTPIIASKYEICANLMKAGAIEATQCKPVPGYTAPVQQQMGPPPVPGAYRYRRW